MRPRIRLTLSTLAIGAAVVLGGCSVLPSTPAPSPTTEPETEAPNESAEFRYEDEAAGFAITFPGEPMVEGVQGNETGAQRATYSADPPEGTPFYTAGGTKESQNPADGETFELLIARMQATGFADEILDVTSIDLDGLEARRGDLILGDGEEASVVLAGAGSSFYQLLVVGATLDERQAFFDSFELLD